VLGDTIAAVASPRGSASRGVVRVSGQEAFAVAARALGMDVARARGARAVRIDVLGHGVAGFALCMPGPGSYTGEDVVELHLPGGAILLGHALAALRRAGARDATPGEFTRRAFENGRLSLEQAEAVLGLIQAESEAAAQQATRVLRGGLRDVVARVRGQVEEALALIEAGLDFTEGETGAVAEQMWQPHLAAAQAEVAAALAGLPAAAAHGELLLVGAANAGKSSLCNALVRRDRLLVDAAAGTTRDVVRVSLDGGCVLLDAPGDWPAGGTQAGVDRAALELRDRLAARAAARLLVIDASAPVVPDAPAGARVAAVVFTKIDLSVPPAVAGFPGVPRFAVSSVTGDGIARLAAFLGGLGGASTSAWAERPRAELEAAAGELERARHSRDDALVASDLRAALRALDGIDGRSTPEDVLDRVFARFCLGK
jgi:tRNA modification GTPase